jgi:hypothetical protein
MDHSDWLLAVIDDPEALRLNAILLVFCALGGAVAVVLNRIRDVRVAARSPYRAK